MVKGGKMGRKEPRYMSYLLRLWQTRSRGQLIWRASLQSPGSSERRGFASLDDLFAFLRQETPRSPDANGNDRGSDFRPSATQLATTCSAPPEAGGGDQGQQDETNVSEDNQASSPDEKENHTTLPQAETGGRP